MLTTFTVDTFLDSADANPGDGIAVDINGLTSLRAAITEANSLAGEDTVDFEASLGGGTIRLTMGELLILSHLNVVGPGADLVTISGDADSNGLGDTRLFHVALPATATISGLTLSQGRPSTGNGAAIYNAGRLTLDAAAVRGNAVVALLALGGGVYNDGGTLVVTNSEISENTGGGIYNSRGTLTVTNSTVSGNFGGAGGGITNSGVAKIVNSTIVNNIGGSAGGIENLISNLSAPPELTVHNTIVAGNVGSDITTTTPVTVNHSLIFNPSGLSLAVGSGSNVHGLDPVLGPLAFNGDTTRTHALLAGSPAFDAGSNLLALDHTGQPLIGDQRVFVRLADGPDGNALATVDIGAFEAHASIDNFANVFAGVNAALQIPLSFGDIAMGAVVDVESSNEALVPNDPANLSIVGSSHTRTLQITPLAGRLGQTTITLTVAAGGQSMVDTFVLTIDNAPVANAKGPYAVNLGEAVTLDGTASTDPDAASGDSIVNYSWSIAGGTYTLTGATPVLTAAQINLLGPGNFPVALTVTDSVGLGTTATTTLSVYENRPIASFTVSADSTVLNQIVTFDASSSSHGRPDRQVVSYIWNFGDGTMATGVTATHAYSALGNYTVTLTVADNNAPSVLDTETLVIQVIRENDPPTAKPGGPYTFDLGASSLMLNGSASTDPDFAEGDALSYAWDIDDDGQFDDGSTAMVTFTAAQLQALGLNAAGTYAIHLRVTDTLGASDVASTTIDVFDNRPLASFTALPNPAAPSQTISFDASSSSHTRPGRQITSYTWDFGDGTTATGVNVSHTFAAFGSYTVTLTVADNNVPQKTATASTTIAIDLGNVPPVANANGPYVANLGEGLTLSSHGSIDPNAAAGDSIVSYSWNIGQGAQMLIGPAPLLNAVQINTLAVNLGVGVALPIALTVTDEFGATNTVATSLTIYDNRPSASLMAAPSPAAPGQAITFDAAASSHGRPIDRGIVRYDFVFGDGTTYTETPTNAPDGSFDGKTTHAYSLFGSFDASVTVTDNNVSPKSASASTMIQVTAGNHAPVADSGEPYRVELGAGVTLDGSGSLDPDAAAGDSIVSYAWNIAGGQLLRSGSMPSLTAPEVNALGGGTFNLVLTVTDEFGATGVAQTTLTIAPPNRPPVAHAGGPYFLTEGTAQALDGTLSSDPDEPSTALLYAWDLDYDFLTFDVDATGSQPAVRFDNEFLPRTIALRVTDSGGSSTVGTSTLQVSNVAPILDGSGQPSLNPVEQNNADNHAGTLISELLARGASGNPISDPGADPSGIAIVAADSTHGGWQYSIDDGATWQALGAVSEANARLLAADTSTRIRLIPDGIFDGAIDDAIRFRAWDQSQGANGATFNVAINGSGGNTAFSSEIETALQFVTPPVTTQPGLTGVTLQNGTLVIEGNDGDDQITVTGIGAGAGIYQITTLDGTQTFSGVTGSIVVSLGAGDDSLVMNNVYVAGALDIQTGDGGDTVILGSDDVVSTGGELRIDLGAGNDALDGKRLYIGTNQIINGGDGDDDLIFDGFLSPQFTLGTSAAGNVAWSGGSGNDSVRVIYAFVVGAWVVDLGDGEDAVSIYGSAASGDVIVLGGNGADAFNIDTNFFDANMRIEGHDGSDSVLLANGLGTEVAMIQTHGLNDNMTVLNQTARELHLDTGAGEDDVKVNSSAIDRFFAALGDANDQLTFQGNRFRSTVDLDGGPGSADRLSELNNTFMNLHRRRAFELFG